MPDQVTLKTHSAQYVFDVISLGTIIAFSDGTPKPLACHKRKRNRWEDRNGTGELIRKTHMANYKTYSLPASMTLLVSKVRENGIGLVVRQYSFNVDTDLQFEVVKTPTPGSIHIVKRNTRGSALLHTAEGHKSADGWLEKHLQIDCMSEVVMPEVPTLHIV